MAEVIIWAAVETVPPGRSRRRDHELTDEEWALIEPPMLPPSTGRASPDHRTIGSGVRFWASTGIQWRDLPDRFGPCRRCPSGSAGGRMTDARWPSCGRWPCPGAGAAHGLCRIGWRATRGITSPRRAATCAAEDQGRGPEPQAAGVLAAEARSAVHVRQVDTLPTELSRAVRRLAEGIPPGRHLPGSRSRL